MIPLLATGDDSLAGRLLDDVGRTRLSADERNELADELARAEDLRRTLA